ncbi:MAG: SGNH/GDSL hydrolase family protein, partial [Candidatus Omnitrophica bacterium]|nr:SGNH/GDSL hydrolase family protein [Candidatus Omnitrophota bacterium]
ADRVFGSVFMWASLTALFVVFLVHLVRHLSQSKNKWVSDIAIVVISVVVSLLVAEGVVRGVGVEPWLSQSNRITVDPGGRLEQVHPSLGYSLIPGEFTVMLPRGYSFKATHLADGARITHPLATYGELPKKKEIWVFGCSFTYGWSLNDDETYPWLLQEQFPDYEVVNFGNLGYSTLHAMIGFEEALKKRDKPALVIYSYASFHDERNVFTRNRRKAVGPENKLGPFGQPYARLENGRLNYYRTEGVEYHPFPLQEQSALVHWIEQNYNAFEVASSNASAVTEEILTDFAHAARKNNVPFVVAGIDSESRKMLEFLRQKGIPTVDISVDLSQQQKYRNLPYDSHPNALANRIYAEKLGDYLRREILKTSEQVTVPVQASSSERQ